MSRGVCIVHAADIWEAEIQDSILANINAVTDCIIT